MGSGGLWALGTETEGGSEDALCTLGCACKDGTIAAQLIHPANARGAGGGAVGLWGIEGGLTLGIDQRGRAVVEEPEELCPCHHNAVVSSHVSDVGQ